MCEELLKMPTKRRSFAKFMYKEYSAVVVKPLSEAANNLHLLDVLVKVKDEDRHPVLENAGCMLKLGISEAPFQETREELQEDLAKFQKDEESKYFSSKGGFQGLFEKFSSASCLAGSLLSGVVDAELNLFTRGEGVAVWLESLETVIVDKEHLENIILNCQWKPDTENNRLKKWPQRCLWFPGTQTRGRKMWLVHQLLYASKVVVKSVDFSSHGGRLAASAIPALTMGPTPGTGLTVHQMADESLEVVPEPGKKILIGFRAISFRFDAEGNVCHFQRDAGNQYPVVRDEDSCNSIRPHLRGLFLEKPPTDDEEEEEEEEEEDEDENEDEEWDVQALDIHTGPHESS